MKKFAIALILISVAVVGYFVLFTEEPAAPPVVARDDVTLRHTSAGDVVGFIDRHGARAWLGLPYAEPPVDARRWRTPEPVQPWTGVREALSVGRACPQLKSFLGDGSGAPDSVIDGAEDCLYLNIWSPANARDLPVMFWIHGGGNSIGHGGYYNGATLATSQDVVVVTINYRLGPLGWFSHPALDRGNPEDDSGNYGTLDVIRALEWTRDNIAEFGGDPGNVTVFGESAGAFDTLAMMASPLAAGLFHRAIVQSGGYSPTELAKARRYASEGGHPLSAPEIVNRLLVADGTAADAAQASTFQTDMGRESLREYLYGKSAEEIFSALNEQSFAGMINTPALFNDGHVLPAMSPEAIFSSAENHNMVPVILGTNRDEPALFMAMVPENLDMFLWVFPRLKDEESYLRSVRYGALAWKARGVDSLASYMRAAGNPNVYAYRFDWDEEGSTFGYDLSKALGAAHGLEIAFVFGSFDRASSALGDIYAASEGRDGLSASMMSYWSQFARTGDPGRGRDGAETEWLAWGEDGQRSIVLDTVQDHGIRMMDQEVTMAGIKAELAADTSIDDPRERCRLYVATFNWTGFDRAEYDSFGPDGCADYDPSEFSPF
jgi:para-nitrobenzyl esterase